MTTLKLAEGLALPPEAVTEKIGFIGRTGTGKTYAGQKLAELFHAIGAQFVCLDPVGKWWALRLDADGTSPALLGHPPAGGDPDLDHQAGQRGGWVSLTAELREARVRRVLQDWRRGVGFDPSPVSDRRTAAGWTWPKGYTGQRTERGEMLGDPPASDAMVGTS